MDSFKVGDLVEVIGCWTTSGTRYIGRRGRITHLALRMNPFHEKVPSAFLDIETHPIKGFDLMHLRKIPPDSDNKSHIHKDTLKLFDGHKVSNPDKETADV